MALASLGRKDEALEHLDELEETITDNGEVMHDIARGMAILGLKDRAEKLLKKAVTIYAGPSVKEIMLDPHFADIRDDFNLPE